jgi:hypothetical protein
MSRAPDFDANSCMDGQAGSGSPEMSVLMLPRQEAHR